MNELMVGNPIAERITYRQLRANEKILKEIGKVLGEIGELAPSQAYTIGQQLKYGDSLQRIVKILSEASQINEVEIYKLLELEAKNNLNFSKKYYLAKDIDFIPYNENIALQNKVNEIAMVTLNNYRNIARTTGLTYFDIYGNKVTKPIIVAYNEIVDTAIINVSQGKSTFYEELARQLKEIGKNGIQSIGYDKRKRRIDSALSMNIQDGLNQLSMAQQEIMGEQFGADGVEITVHEFPAPDHAEVQGHIFKKEEFIKLQNDGIAKDINGRVIDIHGTLVNGEITDHFRPIGELNCYHRTFSIVLGISKPRYTQKELDAINERNIKGVEYEGKHYTMYQATQVQRRLETEIRKSKEQEIMLNNPNLKNELIEQKQETLTLYKEYQKFSKASGLPMQLERTRLLTKNK